MEPYTALGGGLALFGSKDIIIKLLGPTADYLGGALRDYTKKSCENISRIFDIAIRRLGSKVEEEGQVSPKVLKEVLSQGYFCEDHLAAEYFGGILASSRTTVGRDDRGAAIIGLIGRLSSYQIRCHYLFYSALSAIYKGDTRSLALSKDRRKFGLFVPHDSINDSMEFDTKENNNILMPHVMYGLSREDLIANSWLSSTPDLIKKEFHYNVPCSGILWYPSPNGIELFMWAHGITDRPFREFFHPDLLFYPVEKITPLVNMLRTRDL